MTTINSNKVQSVILDKDGTIIDVHHYWIGMSRLRIQSILSEPSIPSSEHYIISNTDSTNSLNVKVQFSENGSDWFDAQGYTGAAGVTVLAGSYNAFSTDVTHHFYRVRLQSTSAGNHATFKTFWNYVSLNN